MISTSDAREGVTTFRTWRDTSGDELRAKFVKVEDRTVILKTARIMKVPFLNLSPEDQRWVIEELRATKKDKIADKLEGKRSGFDPRTGSGMSSLDGEEGMRRGGTLDGSDRYGSRKTPSTPAYGPRASERLAEGGGSMAGFKGGKDRPETSDSGSAGFTSSGRNPFGPMAKGASKRPQDFDSNAVAASDSKTPADLFKPSLDNAPTFDGETDGEVLDEENLIDLETDLDDSGASLTGKDREQIIFFGGTAFILAIVMFGLVMLGMIALAVFRHRERVHRIQNRRYW